MAQRGRSVTVAITVTLCDDTTTVTLVVDRARHGVLDGVPLDATVDEVDRRAEGIRRCPT